MPTLNISLPEPMRVYVKRQMKSGGFSTASEYVRALIREDQRQRAQEHLESMLLEGLGSGEAKKMTQEDWKELRREVGKRVGERPSRGR
jgi:antitoxin ParD1/3/4